MPKNIDKNSDVLNYKLIDPSSNSQILQDVSITKSLAICLHHAYNNVILPVMLALTSN